MFHIDREDLDNVLNAPDYTPEKLIELLKKQYYYFYKHDSGVWEGYTIEQHTLMVLNQFEKYFGNKDLPAGFDKNIFRLILALHDIGKPSAIVNGGKQHQHKYTWKYVRNIFRHLNIDKRTSDIALTLVSGDPLGAFIKGHINKEETKRILEKMAARINLPASQFFELLIVYFKSDAGAYTENAGGLPSLDHLFDFDEKNRNLNFSPEVQARIDELGFKK